MGKGAEQRFLTVVLQSQVIGVLKCNAIIYQLFDQIIRIFEETCFIYFIVMRMYISVNAEH